MHFYNGGKKCTCAPTADVGAMDDGDTDTKNMFS